MLKKIAIVSLLSLVAHADILDYFQEANHNLQYDKTYSLYKQSNQLSQSAIKSTQYANFNAEVGYARTNAHLLNHGFNSTNFVLSDTMDVFGKNSYKIETLQLDLQSQKASMALQKEQLFISLVTMIAIYHRTLEQENLYQTLFNEQEKMYRKLQILEKNGDITKLDVSRFNNTLTTLQSKIVTLENQATKMQKQLKLYVPNQSIPQLQEHEILYKKHRFLEHNPRQNINEFNAQKQNIQAQALKKSYLPTVTTSLAYQQLDDPTSYGNNYAFSVAVNIPLNQGDKKEAEALKVKALTQQSRAIEYKIQREDEYLQHYQAYSNAQKQLDVLNNSLESYKESQKIVKSAYLQRYVDFNTYIQVVRELLGTKEQIIHFSYQRDLEATIINAIGLGKIYE